MCCSVSIPAHARVDHFRGILLHGASKYGENKQLLSRYLPNKKQDDLLKHFNATAKRLAELAEKIYDNDSTCRRLCSGLESARQPYLPSKSVVDSELFLEGIEGDPIVPDLEGLAKILNFLADGANAALAVEPLEKLRKSDPLFIWVLSIAEFWKQHFNTPFYVKPYGDGIYASEALDVLEACIAPLDADVTRETLAYVIDQVCRHLNGSQPTERPLQNVY